MTSPLRNRSSPLLHYHQSGDDKSSSENLHKREKTLGPEEAQAILCPFGVSVTSSIPSKQNSHTQEDAFSLLKAIELRHQSIENKLSEFEKNDRKVQHLEETVARQEKELLENRKTISLLFKKVELLEKSAEESEKRALHMGRVAKKAADLSNELASIMERLEKHDSFKSALRQ